MIGLIIWAILIIFIAACACPGLVTFFLCVALPVGIAVYLLTAWIESKLNK